MGSIHPRPKRVVGHRLALAARAVAYGNKEVVFTGPVLKNCTVGPVNVMCVGPWVPGQGRRCTNDNTGGLKQRQLV